MQTLPAALPEFPRDLDSTVAQVENITLVGDPTRGGAKQAAEEKKSDSKNIKTRALVVNEPKADFEMQGVILDERRENEVLVEMKYSGIFAFRTDSTIQNWGKGSLLYYSSWITRSTKTMPPGILAAIEKSGHTDIVVLQGLLPMIEFPAIFGHKSACFIRAIGSSVRKKFLYSASATCGICTPCQSRIVRVAQYTRT
jgi:hypothetical protein